MAVIETPGSEKDRIGRLIEDDRRAIREARARRVRQRRAAQLVGKRFTRVRDRLRRAYATS
jgi:hypothetical protein